jgi:anti-sigma regulatory factor (Ser/Thr protein kinase)
VTVVITIPASLDEQSFESVIEALAAVPADAKLLVDARHCRFATPYGLTALLCLAQSREEKPDFAPPEEDQTASYWSRSDFFKYADELYTIRGSVPRARAAGDSDVLLEVTPVARNEDVHAIVGRIQEKATQILTQKLDLEPRATMGFAMTLSEACSNIIEHAGRGGWVMVQRYNWAKRRVGRDVVQIAVNDAGIGFRRSLETSRARALADRWDDGVALENGVMNGVSRLQDPGRGQGLKGIRGYVHRFDGKLTVRSGTARVAAVVPDWDDDLARQDGLPLFPGTQLQVIIPKRLVRP